MMKGFSLLTRVLTLVACFLGLPVVLAPVAAQAVVQPCTVSYTQGARTMAPYTDPDPNGHTLTSVGFFITDARVVMDIKVTVDIFHPQAEELTISQLSPQSVNLNPHIFYMSGGTKSGTMNGVYTFDEEMGTSQVSGANPAPGTYDPATLESALEGHPASDAGGDTRDLWFLNGSAQSGSIRSATLTFTYATCDSDGDGIEEKVDNCPTVVNSDQANHDSDALGDACDLDMDGDELGNDADGCPLVATTTKTGCPPATSTARLTYVKTKHRLAVVVRSEVPGCRAGAKVTLTRKKPGRDTKLLVSNTNSKGRYRVKAPRTGGRYYVTVAKFYATGQAECGTARSKPVRVPRRR